MTPWVRRLIIANIIVFLFNEALPVTRGMMAFMPALFLTRPWTIITYMFVHAPLTNITHILFNMLILFFFGPRVEDRLGGKHFITLYLVAGVTGGLLSFAPMYYYSWIVGASGAVYGVELAFAMFWPRQRIHIWGIFPVEAWVLVVFLTGLSLWGGIRGGGNTAHFAHLGGFVGAFLYLKWLDYRSPAKQFKKKMTQPAKRTPGGDGADLKRWSAIDSESLHPVNREEVERVLEKIKASGVGSLTAEERATLDRFST
jgi:membrane associated rhomboid family serine protease